MSTSTIHVGGDERTYYQLKNGLLEPYSQIALPLGAFTYTPPAGEMYYVIGSYWTALDGGGGRLDVRNPRKPLALSGTSLIGQSVASYAVILNPKGTLYSDPQTDWHRRQHILNTLPLKYYPIVAAANGNQIQPFIAGPYGTLLVRGYNQDGLVIGAGVGLNDELAQDAADQPAASWIRNDNSFQIIMQKGILGSLQYEGGQFGNGSGGVAYYNLPANWSTTDPVASSYVFRDDFMGATIDPGIWTVFAPTGSVALDTRFQCVKGVGATDYVNGMISVASYARAASLKLVADIWVGQNATQTLFGFNDGVSVNFSRYNHGLIIDNTGVLQMEWQGGVGADINIAGPLVALSMYRVRITPGLVNGALYEIQGGYAPTGPASPYPIIGSSTWTTLNDTRGASPVNAANMQLAFTAHFPDAVAGGQFLSDVRLYS